MGSNRNGLRVGPSTGWLYAQGILSLVRQGALLREAGANSVEVCLDRVGGRTDSRRVRSLGRGGVFGAQSLVYRSLHLPDVNGQEPKHLALMARNLVALCDAAVAVIHPLKIGDDYPRRYYEEMVTAGVPLALENMDSRQSSGFKPEELEELMASVGCGFVLDVQHACERDSTMKYAADLLESLSGNLMHLHVSGETDSNIHSLVCKATNATRIVDFVGRVLSVKKVPLILEGKYKDAVELRQEIEFLAKELGLR